MAGQIGLVLEGTAPTPLQEAALRWAPAARVILSEFPGENLFDGIASDEELRSFQEIADLTNPVMRARAGEVDLLPPEDRVYGPGTPLVMAAFAWPAANARFSRVHQGAFYAARSETTAIAERRYHTERVLRAAGSGPVVVDLAMLHATLRGTMLDVRAPRPSPSGMYHPADYTVGQELGAVVRKLRGYGIVYDSVRDAGGECVVVFRPSVLSDCAMVRTVQLHWDGERGTVS